ncbi:M48 family metallopeptidase [Acidisoma cellulosilytica]|uniref:M48 family metallopeptidase n=1 Tax=Acidisoma cellulosilyticum TaxID=2802395 RepID=A0A963Z7S4_9PROT|nr:M48 family metallopeptidase [Acidisoma cellulosilyticum]MCB8883437.1 M48 family metallopeptidase [Acidisoma cellulosilyticum]
MAELSRETLALPGGAAQVIWRRSERAQRISLRIDARHGAVVVTLPPRSSKRAGMALLLENGHWVSSRLAALPSGVSFAAGETVPVDGIPHVIRHLPEARGAAWVADGVLHVTGDDSFLPRRVGDFLRQEARRRLSTLAWAHAGQIGLKPRRILIKDTRSRWGSCAPDGSLAFSWRLVMAPPFVQDYVAAHEVAHLRYLNHGAAFWALVAVLCPGWERASDWLRLDGISLMRIG